MISLSLMIFLISAIRMELTHTAKPVRLDASPRTQQLLTHSLCE